MTDYIDREALKEYLYGGKFQEGCAGCDEPGEGCIECIVDETDNFPAADVKPFLRAEWIPYKGGTVCGRCAKGLKRTYGPNDVFMDLSDMPYCPNCGAKMEVLNDD